MAHATLLPLIIFLLGLCPSTNLLASAITSCESTKNGDYFLLRLEEDSHRHGILIIDTPNSSRIERGPMLKIGTRIEFNNPNYSLKIDDNRGYLYYTGDPTEILSWPLKCSTNLIRN